VAKASEIRPRRVVSLQQSHSLGLLLGREHHRPLLRLQLLLDLRLLKLLELQEDLAQVLLQDLGLELEFFDGLLEEAPALSG
jgi:hypothetical protein